MGWKGAVRSIAAAARAAEREAQRRHKQALKEEMAFEAANAVYEWEEFINGLISVHKDLADKIDWKVIEKSDAPKEPKKSNKHEEAARRALEGFKPSIFHLFQGGSGRKKRKLEEDLISAPALDADEYDQAKKLYLKKLAEWEADTKIANGVLNNEGSAIKKVLEEYQNLSNLELVGKAIHFEISEELFHVLPEVHTDEVIPDFRRKQLASGKLSETKMPKGEFNELYQDYVASVALKIAGDMFRLLPVEEVYVTCSTRMLNAGTGHVELTPILSVRFLRKTMETMNLNKVDPSDSLGNFINVMDFKKTKGFSRIEPLVPEKIPGQ